QSPAPSVAHSGTGPPGAAPTRARILAGPEILPRCPRRSNPDNPTPKRGHRPIGPETEVNPEETGDNFPSSDPALTETASPVHDKFPQAAKRIGPRRPGPGRPRTRSAKGL